MPTFGTISTRLSGITNTPSDTSTGSPLTSGGGALLMSCSAGCPVDPGPELATRDDISALRMIRLQSEQCLLRELNIAQILSGVKMWIWPVGPPITGLSQ